MSAPAVRQLLDGQLDTLERPGEDEEDVLTIEADQLLADQVAQVARGVQLLPMARGCAPTVAGTFIL